MREPARRSLLLQLLVAISTAGGALAASDSRDEVRAYGVQQFEGTSATPRQCEHRKNAGRFAKADGYPAAFLSRFYPYELLGACFGIPDRASRSGFSVPARREEGGYP